MTVEVGLGVGWLNFSADSESETSDLGTSLSFAVGGWINPQLAITGRIAAVGLSENDVSVTHVFLGPALQYWLTDQVWFGGGVGFTGFGVSDGSRAERIDGFGFDLRAGCSLSVGGENTLNLSLELIPGFYSEGGESARITGIGVLFGYQHL